MEGKEPIKLNPVIELQRKEFNRKAKELKSMLEDYVGYYHDKGISAEQIKTLINGTYSGIIGFITQEFDDEVCEHIFNLTLETKKKMRERDEKS